MAGGLPGDGEGSINDINVTPLVDVFLVLLIIFMVTAPAILATSIPLDLPEAATAERESGRELGIVVLPNGEILLDGDRISDDALRKSIRAADGPVQALVSADRTTPHGTVVGVLDLLRQEGVDQFAINVVPKDEPTSR